MIKFISLLLRHRHAVQIQFWVNIKTTVATTRLGPLWWILDPLLLMAIYTFVIRIVFERGGPDYHIFALCGIVSWQSFSRSFTLSASSLRSNASLIRQSFLPLEIYVFIPSIVQSFFYIAGLFIICIWRYDLIGIHTFAMPLLLLPLIFLSFGLGLFFSILEVYLPDTAKFLPYILRLGFYVTPILYSVDRIYSLTGVPDFFKLIYTLNPLVHIITFVRDIFFVGQMFNVSQYLILLCLIGILVQVGLCFFRHYSSDIAKSL
jgi:ABC-type polysaccharide/polyol phosphate export permease